MLGIIHRIQYARFDNEMTMATSTNEQDQERALDPSQLNIQHNGLASPRDTIR